MVQHILGEVSQEELLEILAQRAFTEEAAWDTEWMHSDPVLAEIQQEELDAVKAPASVALLSPLGVL